MYHDPSQGNGKARIHPENTEYKTGIGLRCDDWSLQGTMHSLIHTSEQFRVTNLPIGMFLEGGKEKQSDMRRTKLHIVT